MRIFHIISKKEWASQLKSKSPYSPASLEADGFIHCSKSDQLLKVANAFYKGQTGLVVLSIDPNKLESKMLIESPFETPMSEETFPHIYGPLNLDAVVKEIPLKVNSKGQFILDEDLF